MKKLLLMSTMVFFGLKTMAQVTFFVDPPAATAGSYSIVDVATADNNWGCPDMTDPANAVTGNMVFVDDGTTADSLGCNALVNGTAINGSIAVVYRGDCEFGTKAYNAQNEGAIAVIIINNNGDDAFSMLGGTYGASVTIPVIMISMAYGEVLHDDIATGTNTAFIGNKFGYYANDLGCAAKDALRAKQSSTVSTLAQDDTEFDVEVGTWVYNFGSNDQTNVTVNCTITKDGTELYNETSTGAAILSGDSLFVSLPTFSQTSYDLGYYYMEYTIASAAVEDFDYDNNLTTDFYVSDSHYAYASIDSLTGYPVTNYSSNTSTTNLSACIHFTDPNASRMGISGLSFATTASEQDGISLEDKYVEIEAYSWDDAVTDLNDASFALSSLDLITSGEYTYTADDKNVIVSTMFEDPFQLVDDQHYLFCVSTYDPEVRLCFDNSTDYIQNIDSGLSQTVNDGAPTTAINYDGTWYGLGFGSDLQATIALDLIPAVELGIEDQSTEGSDLDVYPNPAKNIINIPFNHTEGTASIQIVDLSGKLVSTQTVNLNNTANTLTLDVTNIANGMYVFNVIYEDGTQSAFNVVINK